MTGYMDQANEVLEKLKEKADPNQLEGMARFGISTERRLGVSVPEMRKIAKEVGTDHHLALKLWQTGIAEAMIVAGMIDEPDKVTTQQMDDWVMDFDSWDICDQVCMNLFEKTPFAWAKIEQWSRQESEFVKRAAYALIACLAWHDKIASDQQFIDLLPLIAREADDPRNYVKKAVSWALRNIGKRNPHLNQIALQTAQELAEMDSKTARWIARDVQRDLTSEVTRKRLAKRSTQ